MSDGWKNCSVCKRTIAWNAQYYVCSVSSCKSERKGFVFCRVQCWDEHKAVLGHRSAWAEELTSPAVSDRDAERSPKRVIVSSPSSHPTSIERAPIGKPVQTETLVVVSKVKALIKDLSDYNTSQCAIDALTEKIVQECRRGIDNARANGRKTVMGRDIN